MIHEPEDRKRSRRRVDGKLLVVSRKRESSCSAKWVRLCFIVAVVCWLSSPGPVESFQRGVSRMYRSPAFYYSHETNRNIIVSTPGKVDEKASKLSTRRCKLSSLLLSSMENENSQSRSTTRKRMQREQVAEGTSREVSERKPARVSKVNGSTSFPHNNDALPDPSKRTTKKKFNTPMPKELLVAIQLNKEIMACETPSDVLNVFIKAGGARNTGGNGALNSINFSTMLHRIAKQTNVVKDLRGGKMSAHKQILVDPRLAILLCAIAEALAEDVSMVASKSGEWAKEHKFFKSRELSNISWALAKLQHLAPPKQDMNVIRCTRSGEVNGVDQGHHVNGDSDVVDIEPEESFVEFTGDLALIVDNLRSTSALLRRQILQIAQSKKVGSGEDALSRTSYMPILCKLAGHILDAVAASVLDSINVSDFNTQEYANLLWAFATVKRGDTMLSEKLALGLLCRAKLNARDAVGNNKQNHGMKPQEVSNSVWALATMGARGPHQVAFVEYAAELLDDRDSETLVDDRNAFLHSFKPQELANTAWGAVTLLSKRPDQTSEVEDPIDVSECDEEGTDAESLAVHRILRRVLRILTDSPESFKSQEVSNILWACATTKFGCSAQQPPQIDLLNDASLMREALIRVAYSAAKRLHEFLPQELNNMSWAYARLMEPITSNPYTTKEKCIAGGEVARDAVINLFSGIGSEIQRRQTMLAPQDIGTTLWAYATLGFSFSSYGEEDLVIAEGLDAAAGVDKHEIADIENIYKTGAKLVSVIGAHTFKPQELSNILWALATAGMIPKYLDAFDVTAAPVNRINVSDTDVRDDPITMCFGAAAQELIRRPHEFKEQEIKDTLWSFSKVGLRHPELFRRTGEHLVGPATDELPEVQDVHNFRGLSEFSPQGLGNLAWSFAKQATHYVEIPNDTETNGYNVNGSNGRLAVYETSCLDLGEGLVTKLYASIAEVCMLSKSGLNIFKPQDLSNLIWSFATLGLLHTGFFAAVSEEVAERISHCAIPKYRGESFVTTPFLAPFKPQEIANLMWAYATVNFRSPRMLDAMASYIVACCRSRDGTFDERSIAATFNRQELANLAWSYAVLEQYPPDLMSVLYTGLLGKNGDADYMRTVMRDLGLQRQAITTLMYVQLVVGIEAPHLGLSLPDNFPAGWGERSSNSLDHLSDKPTCELNPSKTQSMISRALDRIGFDNVQEFVFEPPLDILSIDIAKPKERIGIEVDGPAHFVNVLDDVLSNSPVDSALPFVRSRTPSPEVIHVKNRKRALFRWEWNGRRHENGPTGLKHRILCHLGWQIAHIPFWEWSSVAGNVIDEDNYLRGLLKEVSDPDDDDEDEYLGDDEEVV